jgi:riboflavin synthase
VFTGLIEDLGELVQLERNELGARLTIRSALAGQLSEGDSVAVNGVCLTATEIGDGSFSADAINETLSRSSLGDAQLGSPLNLELPVRANGHLGGHIVQGHIDGVGSVAATREDGIALVVTVTAAPELLRYVAEKGSIAVDGVSLTVARVDDQGFDVWLIPETTQRTNLGGAAAGRTVNLEVDILAKYVERLLATSQ